LALTVFPHLGLLHKLQSLFFTPLAERIRRTPLRGFVAPRLETNLVKFLQYGVSQELGQRAVTAGLTITKVRTASQKDIKDKGFTGEEAKALKAAVVRQPIDEAVLLSLLENSNYLCNCCKGDKGQSFIVHHIEE